MAPYADIQTLWHMTPAPSATRMRMAAQRRAGWLLLIVFLHAVLAHSIAPATGRQAAAGSVHMLFCSVDGNRFVEVELPGVRAESEPGSESESESESESRHDGFCPLCLSAATLARIGVAGFLPDLSRTVRTPAWGDAEPRLARVWNPTHARAPPAAGV